MKKTGKLILIILIIFGLILLAAEEALANFEETNIELEQEIDFVDANLRDIIYTFAAVYDLNVYVYENVTGRASIKLGDKGGVSVLEDLIKSSGYSWEEKNDVIYIGSKKNLSESSKENLQARGSWILKTITFPKNWNEDWDMMLDRFYPDVMRIINRENNIIVIAGEEKLVTRKKEFIEALFPVDENQVEENYSEETEILSVPADDNYQFNFLEMLTDLSYRDFSESGFIFLSGAKEQVISGVNLIEDYIEKFDSKEELITLNYISAVNLKKNLENFVPGMNFEALDDSRLIVSGNTGEIDEIKNIIAKLDIPPRQVMIELEVFEFSQVDSEHPTSLLPPSIELDKKIPGSIEFNLVWDEFISAAREKGEMEILASARLSAIAGELSRIHIGESFPIVVEEGDKERIEYLDSGIILQVLAEINDREEIELSIEPEVSTAEMTTNGYPSFNTRKLISSIRLKDGQKFYLGGITRDQLQMTDEKNPVLANIPLLGNLFNKKYISKESSELIISITPYLLEEDNGDLQENFKQKRIY